MCEQSPGMSAGDNDQYVSPGDSSTSVTTEVNDTLYMTRESYCISKELDDDSLHRSSPLVPGTIDYHTHSYVTQYSSSDEIYYTSNCSSDEAQSTSPPDSGEETHYTSSGAVEDIPRHSDVDDLDDLAAEAQSGKPNWTHINHAYTNTLIMVYHNTMYACVGFIEI